MVDKADSKQADLNKSSKSAGAKTDEDALSKLGYAERRVNQRGEKPGKVGFDDLGNAQFQWDQSLLGEGAEHETRRDRALTIANLVLVDEDPPPDMPAVVLNKKGLRQGYNPYDSGHLEKQSWRKPRDLRALSKWIEDQKKLGQDKDSSDDE